MRAAIAPGLDAMFFPAAVSVLDELGAEPSWQAVCIAPGEVLELPDAPPMIRIMFASGNTHYVSLERLAGSWAVRPAA